MKRQYDKYSSSTYSKSNKTQSNILNNSSSLIDSTHYYGGKYTYAKIGSYTSFNKSHSTSTSNNYLTDSNNISQTNNYLDAYDTKIDFNNYLDSCNPKQEPINSLECYNSNDFYDCCNSYNNCIQIRDCYNLYDYTLHQETVTVSKGNDVEFLLTANDCEIRVDATISDKKVTLIYGDVHDKCGCPAEGVLVTLVIPILIRGCIQYIKDSCTITDSLGNFQFYKPYTKDNLNYKIILGDKINN